MSKSRFMILTLLLIAVASVYLIFKPSKTTTIPVTIKNENFNLEVAKTIQQQTVGLMNRQTLCPNCGMIFVFGIELPQTFWMKNTSIPLDIIFLDKNGQVVNISQGTPKSLDLIPSVKPAQYVIELNAGDSQRINLKAGDFIPLPW